MVLGVCRKIVRDDHESEDAFQATFLVLAIKGRSAPGFATHWGRGCTESHAGSRSAQS